MGRKQYEQTRDEVDKILAYQPRRFKIGIAPLNEQERDNLTTYVRKNGYILSSIDTRAKTAEFEEL